MILDLSKLKTVFNERAKAILLIQLILIRNIFASIFVIQFLKTNTIRLDSKKYPVGSYNITLFTVHTVQTVCSNKHRMTTSIFYSLSSTQK